ncbi:unnamed protein product [Porites evermanni]|uniref:Tudor domain-containing protein n=1 Tax=Porites evermanni TaxID=104178 RepID=A0ABN8PI00_9CNID|nr:unnamed protein product [Porites evermanni]
MAAKCGEVVFKAGEDGNESDIWDDTALIEAYDRAISAIKKGGKNGGSKSKGNGKHRKNQASKKKDNKKKAAEQWHVGDSCRAVFSEDELIYDAVIISIDANSKTCVVKFCGYGNTEEQYLDDLLLPISKKNRKPPKHSSSQPAWPTSPGQQNADSEMDWTAGSQSPIRWQISDLCLAPEQPSQHLHEAVINSFSTPYTCKVTFLRSRQRQDVDVSTLKPSQPSHHLRNHHRHHHHPYTSEQRYPMSGSPFSSYPLSSNYNPSTNFFPPAPPPPLPPNLLPHHWPTLNPSGLSPSSNTFQYAPVPPPPAPVNNSDISHDNDALASMLMAWYLSGYHTGYYQAMQNLRCGSSLRNNEAPVSSTDSDVNKKDSSQPPTT